MPTTLDDLRRLAVTQSLFPPTTLKRALEKLGFVQADPIRAPARAQDLMLRHRVKNYRAGDLERHYADLGVEEDFFINYGFVTKYVHTLMHPRSDSSVPDNGRLPWPAIRRKRAQLILEYVRERGAVHPREVDKHFSHGKVTNYWGGSSNATTHLLDAMHYHGLLRVVWRENGIRIYAAQEHGPTIDGAAIRQARIDVLVDVAVQLYAPLPERSLSTVVRRLRYAVPQWEGEITSALQRARQRLKHTRIGKIDWYWPSNAAHSLPDDRVRLLTPFDPIVWDRMRFELLWDWIYRFEAYTPLPKRKLGYYALPILWRDRVIGWGNLSVKNAELKSKFGYIKSPPRDRVFVRELAAELDRIRLFLGFKA